MTQPPTGPHDEPTRVGSGPAPGPPPYRPAPPAYPPPPYPPGQGQGLPWPQQPAWGPPGPPPPAPGRAKAWWIAAAVVVVLLASGGAVATLLLLNDGDDERRPSTASRSSTPDPSATASAPTVTPATPEITEISVAAVMGSWTGTYLCGQGESAMDLLIYDAGGGRLDARMSFGPTPSNPTVPKGSFAMEGTLEDDVMTLTGTTWIEQPDGYGLIDLSATLADPAPARIDGSVDTDGCGTFTITR